MPGDDHLTTAFESRPKEVAFRRARLEVVSGVDRGSAVVSDGEELAVGTDAPRDRSHGLGSITRVAGPSRSTTGGTGPP